MGGSLGTVATQGPRAHSQSLASRMESVGLSRIAALDVSCNLVGEEIHAAVQGIGGKVEDTRTGVSDG